MVRLGSGSVLVVVGLVLLPAVVTADDSLRCSGGLVSVGDSKLDLVGRCGRPALEESEGEHTVALREWRGGGWWSHRVTAARERWTYDFGSNQFIHIVTLELGKIVRIERGGYGYGKEPAAAQPPIPRARCAERSFHEGDAVYDVLTRCGEPAFREVRLDVRARVSSDGGPVVEAQSVTVAVEVWTYDFGPGTFVRHLTFEDGKLVRIETGSYGYAR